MRLTKGWMWVLLVAFWSASVVGCGCGDDDDDDSGGGGATDDDTTDDDAGDDDATDDDAGDDDTDDDTDDDADDDVEPQCVDGDGDTRGENCDAGPDCDDANPNTWTSCATCADTDADGFFAGCDAYTTIDGPDCNDGNPAVWQFLTGFIDADGDYFYGTEIQVCSGATLPGGYADEGDDCDDTNPDVNPNGFEIPDDGIDQDCDDGDFIASDTNGFFVNEATGNDANPGTKAAPFATIQKGIDEAAAVDGGENVYVAGGTYDESIITNEASLFGGYDPADWTRDLVNNPSIINGQTTFAVYALPTQPVTIDGFQVNMPDSVPTQSVGIMAAGGTIRISNNIIAGGDDSAKNYGIYSFLTIDATIVDNQVTTGQNITGTTYGMFAYALSADIRNNIIETPQTASMALGIYALAASSRVNGNDIDVGDPALSGYGLYLAGIAPTSSFEVNGNTVDGADGAAGAAIGIYAIIADFSLSDNVIDGGDGAVNSLGFYSQLSLGLFAEGNIFRAGSGGVNFGAYAYNVGDSVFENNLIHAGSATTSSIGFFLTNVDGESVISNNTILAAPGGSNYSFGALLYPYQDSVLSPMTVINNTITVGAAAGDSYGVFFGNDSSGAQLTFIANNITSSATPDCLFWQDDTSDCITDIADVNDCSWTDCAAASMNLNVGAGFVNAGGGNFDLTAGSALVDAGVNPFIYLPGPAATLLNYDVLNRPRPRGAGWDIGAYERQP